MEIDLEPVRLDTIVRDVVDQFETQVHQKKLALNVVMPERIAPFTTDPTKVQQILMNLVGNAIKFTETGSVTVTVTTDPDTGKPVLLTVKDSGIGIPEDRITAIFDAFEQAERSTTRKYGGTGLGLPICRSLCDLLGFELKVSSEVGAGSTFTVNFRPAPRFSEGVYEMLPSPEAESAGADALLLGKLVLIIDDEADSRMLIAHQIASLAGRSVGAGNGADALRIAREIKPDLITLDLLMPEMDGWDVMQALKADPDLKDIPVLIVSLVARERGKGMAGAISVLSKPLDRGSLADALKRGVGIGRVLVVEDDVDSQYLLASYLYEEGAAEVRAVAGADDAIKALEEFLPDLVLLDLVVPQGGGEAFLQALARLDPPGSPQVIVVTSKELTANQIRDLETVTLTVVRKGQDLEQNLKRGLREFSAKRRLSPDRPKPKIDV
jgi:CheY-like chemotaxis protein